MAAPRDDDTVLLKEQVLADVLTWFAAGGVVVAGLFLLQFSREPMPTTNLLLPMVCVALLPGFLLIRPAFGYPRTAVVFLGYLLLLCSYLQVERGMTPGGTLGTIAFLLLAGLFFGARGARWAFVASLFSLLVCGLISTSTEAARWELEYWDPRKPIVWVRYAAVLLFFGGALLSAFTKLTEGIVRSKAQLKQTLERERQERKQKERAEEALEHAQRLEALAQFAGGLAHDFNNNLMVIMGGTGLLADDPDCNERVRGIAREIGKSAEAAAEMVRHLLNLGRHTKTAPVRVSAEAIVKQCRSTLRRVLPEGVKLRIEVDAQAELLVEVAGIQQALLNLALNARDALGDAGNFSLRVEQRMIREIPAGFAVKPGKFVVITCEDDGCGMDEGTQTRLFEPFFTTKAAGKGTGLGLATVRRLVVASGGFITVESRPHAGSTFRLHFPALQAHAPSDPSPSGELALRSVETH